MLRFPQANKARGIQVLASSRSFTIGHSILLLLLKSSARM